MIELDEWIDEHREELIAATQAVMRIKSEKGPAAPMAPFGPGVAAALNFMLDYGKARGMTAKNLDGYAGHLEIGRGDELIGVLAHVDVVPAGSDWTMPPYGAMIQDGRLYGRGAIDNKGPAMASLFAMRAIQETRLPVRRRARLILGGDEESGWECMEHYFAHEEQPLMGFTPDATFPIIQAEKGIANIQLVWNPTETALGGRDSFVLVALEGGNRPNMVPDRAWADIVTESEHVNLIVQRVNEWNDKDKDHIQCNVYTDRIRIIADGISAHGSTPEQGVNAIAILLRCLAYLYSSFGVEAPVWRSLANWASDASGCAMNLDLADDLTGHLTANLGEIRFNGAELGAVWNIRYPLDRQPEDIISRLNAVTDFPAEWSVLGGHAPLKVDADHVLIRTLQKTYEEMTGETAQLLSIGGGTYARALDVGVAFGPLFPGREETAHKKDEYIILDDLVLCTKIYARALYALMEAPVL